MKNLSTKFLGRHYIRLDEVGSTSDYLKENAASLPHGTAVTARLQTKGKGRLGKSWQADPGDCLMLSVLLKRDFPPELGVLPLIAGIATAGALAEFTPISAAIGLKWSNDVLLGEKKVSGILCESRMNGEASFAVAGIGVNLRQSEEAFRRLGLLYAASLFSVTGTAPEEEAMAAAVLNHLESCLTAARERGFGALLPRYRALCVNLGRPVRVALNGEEREGVAVDITPAGALLCEIGGALVPVSAGEASVRGIYGYV